MVPVHMEMRQGIFFSSGLLLWVMNDTILFIHYSLGLYYYYHKLSSSSSSSSSSLSSSWSSLLLYLVNVHKAIHVMWMIFLLTCHSDRWCIALTCQCIMFQAYLICLICFYAILTYGSEHFNVIWQRVCNVGSKC